jgi:hypothetical protein
MQVVVDRWLRMGGAPGDGSELQIRCSALGVELEHATSKIDWQTVFGCVDWLGDFFGAANLRTFCGGVGGEASHH